MTEDTDYSDGSETLKSDGAFQNRDVLKWVDRLERAKRFADSAEVAVKTIAGILADEPRRAFVKAWTAHTRDKSAPRSVIADVNIMPPVLKKIHKDDKDRIFIRYKDYPFYYVLSITSMFTVCPASADSVADESSVAEWFNGVIVPQVSEDVLSAVDRELGKKFSNLFHFPKGKDDYAESMINVVFTSSLRVTLANSGRPRSGIMPFRDSDDYGEMLKSEVSVAMGRCISIEPQTVA